MNVSSIEISQDTAVRKIADIKALKKSQRTEEDDALLALYSSVAKHEARVITLSSAFKQAGLNEFGQPRLAIAQGDWKKVFFECTYQTRNEPSTYGAKFSIRSDMWRVRAAKDLIRVGPGIFSSPTTHNVISSPVPHVPAGIRPKFHLRNYHILFEVEKWTVEMPTDPFLLKHIMGETYAVIAEWDLTPLEAQILGSMRIGN